MAGVASYRAYAFQEFAAIPFNRTMRKLDVILAPINAMSAEGWTLCMKSAVMVQTQPDALRCNRSVVSPVEFES